MKRKLRFFAALKIFSLFLLFLEVVIQISSSKLKNRRFTTLKDVVATKLRSERKKKGARKKERKEKERERRKERERLKDKRKRKKEKERKREKNFFLFGGISHANKIDSSRNHSSNGSLFKQRSKDRSNQGRRRRRRKREEEEKKRRKERKEKER